MKHVNHYVEDALKDGSCKITHDFSPTKTGNAFPVEFTLDDEIKTEITRAGWLKIMLIFWSKDGKSKFVKTIFFSQEMVLTNFFNTKFWMFFYTNFLNTKFFLKF